MRSLQSASNRPRILKLIKIIFILAQNSTKHPTMRSSDNSKQNFLVSRLRDTKKIWKISFTKKVQSTGKDRMTVQAMVDFPLKFGRASLSGSYVFLCQSLG